MFKNLEKCKFITFRRVNFVVQRNYINRDPIDNRELILKENYIYPGSHLVNYKSPDL